MSHLYLGFHRLYYTFDNVLFFLFAWISYHDMYAAKDITTNFRQNTYSRYPTVCFKLLSEKKHTCHYRLVNKTYSNTLIIINLRTFWISNPIQLQHIRLTVNVAPIMTWIPKLLSAGISQRAIISLPSNNTVNNAI